MDAHCRPSTCINSAIDTRTRRRNSDTINSCVGSDMGRVPLEAAWIATVVIGVPIIHGFERQGEKIHAISRGMRKDTTSPKGEDCSPSNMQPFNITTYTTESTSESSQW